MKGQRILSSALALALLLTLAAALSQPVLPVLAVRPGWPGTGAQGPEPPEGDAEAEAIGPAAALDDVIPIQGRLTDASGNPVPDGDYTLTFRLYDMSEGGTLLCEDTDGPPADPLNPVHVTNGLFSARMDSCTASDINGRQLYLGIEVGSDGEMRPRQPIYAVPYAWSLRPGANISGTVAGDAVVHAENSATDGRALRGYATAATGTNYGVVGYSHSPDGYGGYFRNDSGGVALKAVGSGIIQSSARSYLWISGNGLQKSDSDDTTRFVYDSYGGYKVYGGADWGVSKTVVLPVTIPGQLYGQNVTVTGLDLYYAISADLTAIDRVAMRRQDGVGAGDTILVDDSDLVCEVAAQCSKHWDLTQNNVLSDTRGILYIAMRLGFSGENAYVHIGGVRLTLEHD